MSPGLVAMVPGSACLRLMARRMLRDRRMEDYELLHLAGEGTVGPVEERRTWCVVVRGQVSVLRLEDDLSPEGGIFYRMEKAEFPES